MKGDARNRDTLYTHSTSVPVTVRATELLTRETFWIKFFGRLNGVYPNAAFHKTVKAKY